MLPIGLSGADRRAYLDTLTVPHEVRWRVKLLDLEHNLVEDLSDMVVDHPEVNWSVVDQEVRSAAQVTLADPSRSLGFTTAAPARGQVHTNRMLYVKHGTYVPALGDWVDVPVFCGRVVRPVRDDVLMTLECHGKERIASRDAWTTRNWPARSKKTDLIRRLLTDVAGDANKKVQIPDWNKRTADEVNVGRGTDPWGLAQKLARSMDAQLFYDARGVARLRRYPRRVSFTFTDGANRPRREVEGQQVGATLASRPVVSFDTTAEFVNTVWVTGRPARAGAQRPEAVVRAPAAHPLSAGSNRRNGVTETRFERIDDDTIRWFSEANEVAESRMDRILTDYVDVEADSALVTLLEPGDLCAVATTEVHQRFRLREFAMSGGRMQVRLRRRGRRSR